MEQKEIGIVELIGVPGSGKSTLVQALSEGTGIISAARLQETVCSQSLSGRLARRFLPAPLDRRAVEMLFQPTLAATIDDVVRRRPALHRVILEAVEAAPGHSAVFRHQMVFWTLRSYALQEIAKQVLPRGARFIHDEGTVHRLATLFAGGGPWQARLWEVRRYMRQVSPIQTLIIVDAPNQVCINRMKTRRAGLPIRFEGATDKEIDGFLNTCRELSFFAGEILEKQGVEVLVVDTNMWSQEEVQAQMQALWMD